MVDSLIPGIPQNLWSSPEDASINLAWSPSAPALSLTTSYKIKRALVSGGPYTTLATITTTTYTDTGRTNGTPYYYVVSALNVNGESSNSTEVSSTPQPVGMTDWQHENEGYLATGPSDDSMAICTEGPVPIRILLNRIERARWTPGGIFRMLQLFGPNIPVHGDQWNDIVQQTFIDYPAHIKQARVGCLFTQLAQVKVENITGEQSLTGTGVGTLRLPPNFFVAGKTVRMRATGFYSAASGDLTIRFKIDNEIVVGTITGIAAAVDKVWRFEADITCLSTGVIGEVIGQGFFFYDDLQVGMPNLTPTVFDTTLLGHTDLTVEWSAADPGNTITVTNITYEVLN